MKHRRPILTKLGDSPKKSHLLNSPLRINSLKTQQRQQRENDLAVEAFSSDDLLPNSYDRSRSLSIQKSRVSQFGTSSKYKRGRNIMEGHLIRLLSQFKKIGKANDIKQIERMTSELRQIVDFEKYVTEYFACYNHCFRLFIENQQNIDSGHVSKDFKLQKKILFQKESSSPRRKQMESIISENESLKKQLFKQRQNKSVLQKRILHLVTQYKQRKLVYMSQIQRLTAIIKTSIQKIPQLINQRNKSKQKMDDRKKGNSTNVQSQNVTKNQYNTLSNINDPITLGLENTYRVLKATGIGRFDRFASEQKEKPSK